MSTNISHDQTVSNIKKITDISFTNTEKFDEIQISQMLWITPENMICIPFESDHCWREVIQFVRQKSKSWRMELFDEFINNEILRFIYQLKTDGQKYSDIGKSVNEWLEYLKNLPAINFCFILPVNNIEHRKDLDFGKVRLTKLDLTKLRKLAPCRGEHNCFNDTILNKLTSYNETETFAIVNVQANNKEQGIILTNLNLKQIIYTIKLFDPKSWIRERKYCLPGTSYYYLVINRDTNEFSEMSSKIYQNSYINKSDDCCEQFASSLNTLKPFLFSKHQNKMQSTILNALHWYGSAEKEEDKVFQFLKYVNGLEHLVIFDNKKEKSKRMAERIMVILEEEDSVHQVYCKKLLEQYYRIRNSIIHSKELVVEKEVVDTTRKLLQRLILKYIDLSKKYTDAETMFKK